jgi:outer membrane immunogenic protein
MKCAVTTTVAVVGLIALSNVASAQSNDAILQRLDRLEQANAKLEKENAALRERVQRVEAGRKNAPSTTQLTTASPTVRAALASADLKAAPLYGKAPPEVGRNWTGIYVGLQGGTGFGTSVVNPTGGRACDVTTGICGALSTIAYPDAFQNSYGWSGLHGGLTAGFNWQPGPIVFGLEGDISGANINGTGDCTFSFSSPVGGNTGCRTKLTALGTFTGRVGVTYDRALMFIKGGGAWAHFNHVATNDETAGTGDVGGGGGLATPPCTPLCTASVGDDRFGFTVGTGIEYSVWSNWSAKVEYDYMDFGSKNLTFSFVNPTTGLLNGIGYANDRERVHLIKAGLNYQFNR